MRASVRRVGATAVAGDWSGPGPKCVKLHLNVQKYAGGSFAVRVAVRWHWWPGEAVGSLTVAILRAHLDSQLQVALLDLERSRPASATCVHLYPVG